MHSKILIVACAGSVLLGACAAAPRAPAASLADAGIQATTAFEADVQGLSDQLAYASVTESFLRTWQACTTLGCEAPEEPAQLTAERLKLANLVALRARAIAALGDAYGALKAEAAYDGGADLQGSVDGAVKSVTAFANAAASAAGAAPLPAISNQVQGLIGFGAKLVGEKRQRGRLLAANRIIGEAARRLRDGMQHESKVFDLMTDTIVMRQTAVRRAFLKEGLIPLSTVLEEFAKPLDLPIVTDTATVIAGSPRLQNALMGAVEGMSTLEVRRMQERYRLSIAALTALVQSHEAFAAKKPIGIADIDRFLSQLDASVDPQPPSGGAQP